jgi:hypothetical protein
METIQVVLDSKLLRATEIAARRGDSGDVSGWEAEAIWAIFDFTALLLRTKPGQWLKTPCAVNLHNEVYRVATAPA